MGFAQEIRDFLSASQSTIKTLSDQTHKAAQDKYTDAKTQETLKEMNDPLNAATKQARLDQIRAATSELRGREALNAATKAELTKPIVPPTSAANITDGGAGSTGLAQPQGQGQAPAIVTPDTAPVRQPFARGGMVRKFAIGGMADEELDPAAPTPQQPINSVAIGRPQRAQPVTPQATPAVGGYGGTAGAEGATAENYEVGARSRKPSSAEVAAGTPIEAPPANAIAESAKYGVQVFGGGEAMNTLLGRKKLEEYMRGANAAPVNEMYDIYKKIDPTGKKYSESERNLRAFNALYQFKLNSNDKEGADRAGAMMLQHHRNAFQQYRAIADAALQGGNLDLATKAAMKSYANILDGRDMKLWVGKDNKIGYEFTRTGEDGKDEKISGGIMSPQELGAVISGRDAKTYDQWLLTAAGQAQQTLNGEKKPAVGKVKPPGSELETPAEYEKTKKRVDSHVEEWHTELMNSPEGKKGKKLDKAELASVKNMLFHTMNHNSITEDEGMRRIQTYLRAPESVEGGKLAFKPVHNPETKMTTLMFPDGFSMELPTGTYNGTFRVARGRALEQAEQARNAPKERTYGELASDTYDAANKGLSGAVGRVLDPVVENAKEGNVLGTAGAYATAIPRAQREVMALPLGAAKAAGSYVYDKAASGAESLAEWARKREHSNIDPYEGTP